MSKTRVQNVHRRWPCTHGNTKWGNVLGRGPLAHPNTRNISAKQSNFEFR